MARLTQNTRSFFIISRGQRNAMLFLLALLLILLLVYFLLPLIIKPTSHTPVAFAEEVRKFLESPVEQNVDKKNLTPFPFDPNTTTREGFVQLGLSEYQADMIIRYVNAGGCFRSAEDFSRIYSISDEEFEQLKPFISISREFQPQVTQTAKSERKLQPFPFDPNIVDSTEMHTMGFTQSQIKNILNYRKSGGQFRVKKDLSKLYTFREEDYLALEKYILLPSTDTLFDTKKENLPKAKVLIEINSADTMTLQQVAGIGPAFAKRIVTYRDKLGGFFDKSQLLEVFGMDTARYVQIAGHLDLDVTKIRRMDLNKTGFKEMVAHPYLEFYIVKSIFDYKEGKGKFDSVAELKQIDLIYQQLYHKLAPYFTLDENPIEMK
ncbi:MAG: hypothetical protein EOM06_11780 [Sphingobacteriia bacterium]|nr:hypothetical protein [Sphingobacteriia bacterium]